MNGRAKTYFAERTCSARSKVRRVSVPRLSCTRVEVAELGVSRCTERGRGWLGERGGDGEGGRSTVREYLSKYSAVVEPDPRHLVQVHKRTFVRVEQDAVTLIRDRLARELGWFMGHAVWPLVG